MQRVLTGLIAAACLVSALPAMAQEVFPDEALRKVVQEIVQKKTGKPDLTEAALGDIYFLRANEKGIKNLAGMEKLTNLAQVELRGNEIADLVPLKGLADIQYLDLRKNKIADIAPLAELMKLQYLQLEHNEITDIKPLAGLTALASLYLSHNKISDLAPIAKLEKLSSLYAGSNAIEKIDPISSVKRLDTLDLQGNKIVDLAPLKPLTELRLTLLQKNKITDLAPLVEMATKDAQGEKRFAPYWELHLGGNPLSEEAKTKQVEALKAAGVDVHLEEQKEAPAEESSSQ